MMVILLCLTSDSPILKADGTIVEVGELEEGDVLSGYLNWRII